ncbi:TOBE domain-containing protein [Methylocystis sp. H4A]|uniref:TOBE domain-containing protein n=1 Tax=Methylocystis sp. H4A TaxID=2785788 RepID=UPI0018C2B493|nr:TOBE domain-containing protein [Methylocystis sp. H4A]
MSGEIIQIKKGSTRAHVRIKANSIIITASITNESVDELGLKVGDSVQAVIKSSDVMIVVP